MKKKSGKKRNRRRRLHQKRSKSQKPQPADSKVERWIEEAEKEIKGF